MHPAADLLSTSKRFATFAEMHCLITITHSIAKGFYLRIALFRLQNLNKYLYMWRTDLVTILKLDYMVDAAK